MSQGKRRAIVDIGSNSIRLVVYGGAPRAPVALYNEKFTAGLGRGVIANGALDENDMAGALDALARFAALIELMQVDSLRVVATAAVREASNGQEFVEKVRAIGLPVQILDGQAEAMASGYGVISAIPDADGLVADLGGGSLELLRVKNGVATNPVSLPLGILRVGEMRIQDPKKLEKQIHKYMDALDWIRECENLPLYLVGGSWRALARVHIHIIKFPLPVIANHVMPPGAASTIMNRLNKMDRATIKDIPRLPSSRISALDDAATLLSALSRKIKPVHFVLCASGLREGLLYQSLSKAKKAEDPLIAGARFTANQHRRFPGYGEALANWLADLFGDDPPEMVRLRHATCLLADLGWNSNPEFRAISGEESALHGNWVGVNARDRAVIAMALFASFGGTNNDVALLSKLAPDAMLDRAKNWGLAIRLAHRLGGGSAGALNPCTLTRTGNRLLLKIDNAHAALDNISVRRRLDHLGQAMTLKAEIIAG